MLSQFPHSIPSEPPQAGKESSPNVVLVHKIPIFQQSWKGPGPTRQCLSPSPLGPWCSLKVSSQQTTRRMMEKMCPEASWRFSHPLAGCILPSHSQIYLQPMCKAHCSGLPATAVTETSMLGALEFELSWRWDGGGNKRKWRHEIPKMGTSYPPILVGEV